MSKKKRTKKKKPKQSKHYQKKLSLYPMTFEEVVDRVLKIKK